MLMATLCALLRCAVAAGACRERGGHPGRLCATCEAARMHVLGTLRAACLHSCGMKQRESYKELAGASAQAWEEGVGSGLLAAGPPNWAAELWGR